ncbi:hypothetical protein SAMN05444483_103213 [Salegentibacter echinorum]|uniref:7-cyano-7-deazaguanine synthase (Queuosine biosynthesis) n=1 Tax=Salegentibacter echinorum TaxID=1073325 RepID=A0A1M5FIY9_SALEC|nr:hypothetical protein [Salegentibacter echinorum]SHF91456.1 hypothetical protein SAMN05444483_103213 [Salegentibacter echinorum]
MLSIEKPKLETFGRQTKISAKFTINDKENELYFEVPSDYKDFLVTENLDAFLVGLLFLALKTGNDIKLNGPVSARLYYSIRHYVIPALCMANPKLKPVDINPQGLNEKDLNVAATSGTGLSCGVDSFATYFDHIDESGSFKIEYFAFFNVGSHGAGGEETKKLFESRFEKAKKFANTVNKNIIQVDSNLHEILDMKFQSTNTLRNVSCILLFQKLFKHYYIASKNRFDYFELNDYDTQDYDALVLNLLSTESTNLYSAVAQLSRVERTNLISNFPETYDFLDVCTSSKKYKAGVNCSQCNKCLRTALTLDLLGKLPLYKDVFHIEKYERLKHNYIWHVITNKNKDQIHRNLYRLIKNKKAMDYTKIAISRAKVKLKGR